VIIDFFNADPLILDRACSYLGKMYVLKQTLGELKKTVEKAELTDLGLHIIEPEPLDLVNAVNNHPSNLSSQDYLCFLTAKRNNFIFATNDKDLRSKCQQNKIPLFWSLEFLAEIYKVNGITFDQAAKFGMSIYNNNSYLSKEILNNYLKYISKLKKEKI
jgi:rRNA-processing protein FCF1